MKNNLRTNFLVLLVSIVTFFTFTQNALSSSFGSGTTTLDWTSFTITYNPVTMSLHWLSNSDQTYAFANIGGPNTTDSDGPISPWGILSSSASLNTGNLYAAATAYTNANIVGQSYDGHVIGSGNNQENGTAGRYGTFTVTGSGDITFSANYHIDYSLNTDGAGGWAFASNTAALYARNYTTSLDTYFVPGSFDHREQTISGAWQNASLNVNGTLQATLHFNNGDAGYFLGFVGDANKVPEWIPAGPPSNPVPEPATMLLLGSGLLGLAGYGRRKFKKI